MYNSGIYIFRRDAIVFSNYVYNWNCKDTGTQQ